MATVSLRGNNIVITFSDGEALVTKYTVDASSDIAERVKTAINYAKGRSFNNPKHLAELNDAKLAAKGAANIQSFLKGKQAPVEPSKPPEKPEKEKAAHPAPKEPKKPSEPKIVPKKTAPEKPGKVETPEPKPKESPKTSVTPQPAVTLTWITETLKLAGVGEKKKGDVAGAAANRIIINATGLWRFLEADQQRGVFRTPGQAQATIAAFTALYQIPRFRDFLANNAGKLPEFAALETFLGDPDKRLADFRKNPNKNPIISEKAPDEIVMVGNKPLMVRNTPVKYFEITMAADIFIRYYLYDIEASKNEGYAKELRQLPGEKSNFRRLENVEGIRNLPPFANRTTKEETAEDKNELTKLYLAGAMDSDTLAATALYLRRWHLENPKAGKGLKQEQIPGWKAPKVAAPVETAPVPATPTEKPKELTELEKFAEAKWKNLPTMLGNTAGAGNPQEFFKITRNVPETYTFESAIAELGRQSDINRAFDVLFNDYLHKQDKNNPFLAFVSSKPEYAGLARPAVVLNENSKPSDRALAAKAVQAFVNFTAGRTDQPWSKNLTQDLALLYSYLGTDITKISIDGRDDMRTVLAAAVTLWRLGHKTSPPCDWAKSIPEVKPFQQTIPAPVPEKGPEVEPGRRRTISGI